MNRKVVIIREFLLVFWKLNTSKKIIEFVIFGVQMMLIFLLRKFPIGLMTMKSTSCNHTH